VCHYSDILNKETFCYGDVLFRRRYVTGDIMLRRRSVTETFCMETFCRGDVLCGDVLYVRQLYTSTEHNFSTIVSVRLYTFIEHIPSFS
jgi:hypothetical protein